MRRIVLAVAVAALIVPSLSGAQGTTVEIATGDDFFEPEDLKSDVGTQSFHWQWGPPSTQNEHNVRQDDELFTSGNLVTAGEFTVNPSAGTFHYYCDAHGFESGGMDGELAIKPTATPQGKKTLITWATETTDTGSQFDVQQKTGSKKPVIVESKTKAVEGAFKLKSGTKYQFEVRTRKGKKTSDWSPVLKLKG